MAAEGDIDTIVREAFFAGKTDGVMVEVGAAKPDFLSISASFRTSGWKIIAVEPNPDFCNAHRELGHEILQYACSDHDEDEVEFTVVDSLGANYLGGAVSYESFSSLGIRGEFANLHGTLAKHRTRLHKIRVNVRKLDTILAEHQPELQKIDLLTIDVEGWEMEVIAGFSVPRYRPDVIILENLFSEMRYREAMRAAGYDMWLSVEPNEIYRPVFPWPSQNTQND